MPRLHSLTGSQRRTSSFSLLRGLMASALLPLTTLLSHTITNLRTVFITDQAFELPSLTWICSPSVDCTTLARQLMPDSTTYHRDSGSSRDFPSDSTGVSRATSRGTRTAIFRCHLSKRLSALDIKCVNCFRLPSL